MNNIIAKSLFVSEYRYRIIYIKISISTYGNVLLTSKYFDLYNIINIKLQNKYNIIKSI